MKLIPLKGKDGVGKFAKVSDADYEMVSRYSWFVGNGYAWARIPMHRLIVGAPRGQIVDHANGDEFDNQRENLRLATAGQSSCNTSMRRGNRSGFKGVCFHGKHGLWRARIQFNKRAFTIGYFENPVHAAMAYDIWAVELFGEFARTNFKAVGRG